MDFLSPRFAGNQVLEEILNDPDTGTVKLGPGSDPEAVTPVQQALWDLRWVQKYAQPIAYADFVIGVYGPVTTDVVQQFKQRYGLHFPPSDPNGIIDGFTGPRTMEELDFQCDLFDEGVAATDQLIADLAATVTITDAAPPDLPATKPILGTRGVERTVSTFDGTTSEVGEIYYTRGGSGAFLVDGAIFQSYLDSGGPQGELGFPISGIFLDMDGVSRSCEFEHGSISLDADGNVTVTPDGTPIDLTDPARQPALGPF